MFTCKMLWRSLARKQIFLRVYLFIYSWETQRERCRDTGRGRSRLHAGTPMLDLIPGPQDHALGWRQVLNRWVIQGSPMKPILYLEDLKPFYPTTEDTKWYTLSNCSFYEISKLHLDPRTMTLLLKGKHILILFIDSWVKMCSSVNHEFLLLASFGVPLRPTSL